VWNSNDLRVIGSTHGGRALWVLAGEDSPGQAWGNRTRGSHRDKALRGQAPKRTILSSTPGYQSQGCYSVGVCVCHPLKPEFVATTFTTHFERQNEISLH
jgi:hypothetical protein